MSIEERVAAMRAGRAAQTQAAPVRKIEHLEKATPAAVVETVAAKEAVFDISTNTVAKIMDRSDLTDKGKLEAVVAFLTAKDADYATAQKNFSEFEVYFTYEQSKRTQVSEQNIQRPSTLTGTDPLSLMKADPADAQLSVIVWLGATTCGTGSR